MGLIRGRVDPVDGPFLGRVNSAVGGYSVFKPFGDIGSDQSPNMSRGYQVSGKNIGGKMICCS